MQAASANLSPVRPAALRLPDHPLGATAEFVVVLILGISYAFNGMDRQVFPALLGPINAEYGLTLAQGGFLSNAFTVNIALFGALSGWFMARFGRKATLVGGLIAYSAFTAATPFATGFGDLTFYRAMTGAGEALHISAIFAMIGAYFGARRGVFMGINNAFFGVGAFLGPVLGTRLFAATGSWRLPFIAFGVAGFVAALTILTAVPRRFTMAMDAETLNVRFADARFFNRNSTLCLVTFALVGCSFFGYAALYTSFLRSQLQFSITAAGTTFGMFGIGALTGFCSGWVGERLKKPGLLVALVLLALDGYALFHGPASTLSQSLLSFAFGALVSGYLYPRIIAITQRSMPAEQIGHAMAVLLVTFYLPGLIVGYTFGRLVEAVGWDLASALIVSAPAALAFIVTLFQVPSRMRGA